MMFNEKRFQAEKSGRIFDSLKKRFVTQVKQTDGYLQFRFWDGVRRRAVSVHRIIASTFIPNPLQLPQVNHKNGIKTDNRIENLEWCTQSQNIRHSYSMGMHKRG